MNILNPIFAIGLTLLSSCTATVNREPQPNEYFGTWSGKFSTLNRKNLSYPRNSIRHSTFVDVNFSGAHFPMLDASDAFIENSNFDEVDFRGAIFRYSSVSHTSINKADFRQANIRNAFFERTSLKNADFRDSLLLFVAFTDSDLSGANFAGARVSGCDFSGTIFDSKTILPFSIAEAVKRGMVDKK